MSPFHGFDELRVDNDCVFATAGAVVPLCFKVNRQFRVINQTGYNRFYHVFIINNNNEVFLV